ncbi:hypothetical protein BDZ90DRAFT_229381 [Jaminaea rosea]|uniref:Maintenance of telomere capping protein 1 n=1 Tax=Jaminaea rosea TaxID=1569628 RepID=A0A316V1D9_9BASI|nr:hypothetical protein BDZ90DRAFT_229381 [Jaminaea rosea]PWN30361.1 hypothetical protein BDZ90DRAFT_229381 [Jaminaea rosea]
MPPKKSSNKDSVEALLSDLDSLGTEDQVASAAKTKAPASSASPAPPAAPASASSSTPDAQSLLDDLDSLVQRRAPTPRRPPSSAAVPSPGPTSSAAETVTPRPANVEGTPKEAPAGESPATSAAQALESMPAPEKQRGSTAPIASAAPAAAASSSGSGGGWGGWGSSMWSSATKFADQARAEIEKRAQSEQARDLGQRGWDLAQGVRGFVKETGWEKLGDDITKVGKRGWTEVINAVAPPISAHEVIQVTLSHDMVGFDGVPDVTFKILSRVMESQVRQHGLDQQLVVNQARNGAQVGDKVDESNERDMQPAKGFEEGWKTAQSSLATLIASHEPEAPKANSVNVPVTNSPVFLRIQPVMAPLPGESATASPPSSIFFLVLLQDPTHGLSHRTCSQAMPYAWLSLPFDQNPWIEQAMVDSLENALAIVGQDYINGRQSGRSVSGEQDAGGAAEA